MERNYTHLRNLRTGKPRNPGSKTNRRKTSSRLTTDYGLMLQLYYLNKKEATMKRELKYKKLVTKKSPANTSNLSYVISGKIVSIYNEGLLLFKKLRSGIAMATE